jgi:hypothetical protein
VKVVAPRTPFAVFEKVIARFGHVRQNQLEIRRVADPVASLLNELAHADNAADNPAEVRSSLSKKMKSRIRIVGDSPPPVKLSDEAAECLILALSRSYQVSEKSNNNGQNGADKSDDDIRPEGIPHR